MGTIQREVLLAYSKLLCVLYGQTADMHFKDFLNNGDTLLNDVKTRDSQERLTRFEMPQSRPIQVFGTSVAQGDSPW